ncbi:MAG: tetratricopeptide repeat protein, partial [Bacteroidaceae bacterium]|nr:tetratricopeptide repeat protein [Bacteroidaceae bacterium]
MKHTVLSILLLFLLAISFTGCQGKKGTATTLAEAEALMYTYPDSARQMLESVLHPERLTGKEQANYALLLSQARSRCRIIATSDSLIRIAADYYQHSNDYARKAA